MVRQVKKVPITAQDIAHGVGKVSQQRGQQVFELDKVDIPFGVPLGASLPSPVVYPRVRQGSVEHQAVNGAYQPTLDVKPAEYGAGRVMTAENPYVYYEGAIFKRIGALPATLSGLSESDGLAPLNPALWELYLGGANSQLIEEILAALNQPTQRDTVSVEDLGQPLPTVDHDPTTDYAYVFSNGSLLAEGSYTLSGNSLILTNPQLFEDLDEIIVVNVPRGVHAFLNLPGLVSAAKYGASPTATPEQNWIAINTALIENAGKAIVVLEDMYTVDRTVLVPSNTYLKGLGKYSGSGLRMASGVSRGEPLVITGHRLQKGENIVIEDLTIDFNRDRWTVGSNSSSWQALAPTGDGIRHTSNQDVTQSSLMVCNSERVLIRNVRSIDGYKHCFDVSAPWYGRAPNTPDPENPGEFIRTALQYDPMPSKYVWFEGCEASGGGDDNFTSHQCSFVWYNNCTVLGTGGVRTGGNSNGFEIDDASRNIWLTNSLAIGCTDAVQVKGHNDSPAPYNVFISNVMSINCRRGLELRHTGWYGSLEDSEDTDPIVDEDGNPITILGGSQTARNVQVSNFQIIAPRQTETEDGVTRPAERGVRIRSYENVTISGLHISDGDLDLAKELDGYLPSTALTGPLVQINRGARNVAIENLIVNGFDSQTDCVRVYGTAGDGITIDGFKVTNGPRRGFYQSGNTSVAVNNFNLIANHEATSGSIGIRMTSEQASFIGYGKVSGYETPARFGGVDHAAVPYGIYQPLYARLGGTIRVTNANGCDIERSSAAGTGRMLRLRRAGADVGYFFGTESSTWLASPEGFPITLGFVNGVESNRDTVFQITPASVRPAANKDDSLNLGNADSRWKEVFATNGVINTSDAREKTEVVGLDANEIQAAKLLAKEIGSYKFLQAVADKGEDARLHVGLTVQRAMEIMVDCGLDPNKYSFICYDSWDEKLAVYEMTEEGMQLSEEAQPAGDRYSFRYNELMMFIARGFEDRLTALEELVNE